MEHTRKELVTFNRKDLEEIASFYAKSRLIGSMYVGAIGEPHVRWLEDGGIEVVVPHTPSRI